MSSFESPSLEDSHNKAWEEKRDKYIVAAIESVLEHKKEEVLGSSPLHFLSLIEHELRAKSGLDTQIPQSQKNAENFEKEFSRDDIKELAFGFFWILDENDYDALGEALKNYYQKS